MNVGTTSSVGVSNIAASYEDTKKNIALILRRRHKLTASEADAAISLSPFSSVFQADPEMAAHTSNEAWARQIFNYWKEKSIDQ